LHEESLRAGKALAAQEGAIESDRKVLADLAKKIARHEEETGRISKERDTAEYEAGRLRETLAGHEKSLEELAGQILDLPGARENRDRTKAEMDRLQVAYDEYMKHTRTAGKTALCEEALAKARDARDRMKALIEEGERRYHEDKSRYSPEEHAGVERDLESATAERNARLLEVGSAKARSDQLRAIFQENETLIKEVEEWRREESLLARKIVLTGSFRDRVNELGKYVSETLMRRVAALASDNFRRLTGRNERIVWENTESESYAVYMAGSKGVVTYFKDLSGGEQVVVALSLRAAITSLLTDVRFAVFDEPTINLDAQRREALAFYLKDLLKGLEQSIIVTHDGTFEEMAKTVVRL
jgi:exonuclease SbcC